MSKSPEFPRSPTGFFGFFKLLAVICVAGSYQYEATQSNAAEVAASNRKEYFDAIFFEDKKVGYLHTTIESVKENGRDLVRTSATSADDSAIRRDNDTAAELQQFGNAHWRGDSF
jgi:hypothetical protein